MAEKTDKPGKLKVEGLRVPWRLNVEYEYAAGHYATKFFQELRDTGRIWGIRCPSCQRVYIPPRPICGICAVKTGEWVQVSDEGVIVGYTVVNVPFIDPMTGEQRPIPYGFAIVRLDGASTAMYHFLEETDPAKLRVGKRVKAVFRSERQGNLLDIKHFRLLE